jgi:drug/metabolite transporter (DMT)-like permease
MGFFVPFYRWQANMHTIHCAGWGEKKNLDKKSLTGTLCLIAASGIWGGMYVVSKYTVSYIEPFMLMWLRFAIACIVLFPALLIMNKKEKLNIRDLRPIAWLAFIGFFVSNGCAFIGVHYSSAHMASLLSATSSIFTIPLAFMLLKEKPSIKKIGSVLIATAGVITVVGFNAGESRSSAIGNLFLIGSAISWGLYSVYLKRISDKYSSLFISVYTTFAALIFTTPVMVWQFDATIIQHLQQPQIGLALLYLGVVSTALAYFLWNQGMKYMEVSYGIMFYFFTPLVGSFLGWIFLHEQLQWNFFLGGLLVLLGMTVGMQTRRNPKEPKRNVELN